MRPVAVVMRHKDVKDPLKMPVIQDQLPVQHSERTVRTNRSATPFAWAFAPSAGKNEQGPTATLAFLAFLGFWNL